MPLSLPSPPKADEADTSFLVEYCGIEKQEAAQRIENTLAACISAYHVYVCIASKKFAIPRIETHPDYGSLKALLSRGATVLELGACFGTDARKLHHDGLAWDRLTVCDLHSGYWNLGQQVLFQDRPPCRVVFGDICLPPQPGDVVDINAFPNAFDVVSAQAILHCLSKKQGHYFLQQIHRSLKQGGMLIGTAVLSIDPEGADWIPIPSTNQCPERETVCRFLHSSDTLSQLLAALGFSHIAVHPCHEHLWLDASDGQAQIMRPFVAIKGK
ncbi:hypothetical protein HDV03_003227 [Kappamyces sp. JEL0829]|nr:hypothetical protein HDV03_003227 [Kappamyces sp. JEL0829]